MKPQGPCDNGHNVSLGFNQRPGSHITQTGSHSSRPPPASAEPALVRPGAERKLSSKGMGAQPLLGTVDIWLRCGTWWVMVYGTFPLSLWLLPSQDPSWNHRVYRLALTKLSPPLIPFMPLLLKGKRASIHLPVSIPSIPAPVCPSDPLSDSSALMPWGTQR